MINEKLKKTLGIIEKVIAWILVVCAVFVMIFTVLSVTMFDKNERNLFGYRIYIVKTDSMAKTDFDAGDLILTKIVDPNTLEAGDIITFQSGDPDSYGETITHKIREKRTDANGNVAFVTYGTTTDTNDETLALGDFVLGKYVGTLPGAGHFFAFLKTTPGYVTCILVPFMLLIIYQGINCVKVFRQYKAEQVAEMEEERRKLEEERKASLEMMKELQALKAQLAAQGATELSGPEDKSEEK
jgi:signal peptidase I